MAEIYFEIEAQDRYDALVGDPLRSQLAEAVDRMLDLLERDPGDSLLRRRSLLLQQSRTTLWKVEIRGSGDEWSLLWMPHPKLSEDVLVVYLGPVQYT